VRAPWGCGRRSWRRRCGPGGDGRPVRGGSGPAVRTADRYSPPIGKWRRGAAGGVRSVFAIGAPAEATDTDPAGFGPPRWSIKIQVWVDRPSPRARAMARSMTEPVVARDRTWCGADAAVVRARRVRRGMGGGWRPRRGGPSGRPPVWPRGGRRPDRWPPRRGACGVSQANRAPDAPADHRRGASRARVRRAVFRPPRSRF